jgi:beta-adrenergic-receptor kinase
MDNSTGDDVTSPSVLGLCRKIPQSPVRSTAFSACKAGGANAVRVGGEYVSQVNSLFAERRLSLSPVKSSSRKIGEGLAISPSLFDPIEEVVFSALKTTHGEGFMQSQDCHRYHQFMAMLHQVQDHGLEENEDFFVLRVVGRGGFGLVNACKKATTGKLYAMKQMSKKRIKLKRCEDLIVAERDTLSQVQSPYVVNLLYAFHNATDVFLILDLMIGGDLNFHLRTKGRFSLRETKYYIARTVLGIAALHDRNYAHRYLRYNLWQCLLFLFLAV